jgi:hypothetical protein
VWILERAVTSLRGKKGYVQPYAVLEMQWMKFYLLFDTYNQQETEHTFPSGS